MSLLPPECNLKRAASPFGCLEIRSLTKAQAQDSNDLQPLTQGPSSAIHGTPLSPRGHSDIASRSRAVRDLRELGASWGA